ncbi:MAG: hypothetical protein ACFFD4_19100 [Candidatus Odinarchaeota archaeon]
MSLECKDLISIYPSPVEGLKFPALLGLSLNVEKGSLVAIVHLLNRINLKQRKSIIMVTHDEPLLEKHLRIVEIVDGETSEVKKNSL